MNKVTVHNVVINRGDVMTKPSKQVWDWELPLLQEKFPGGMVEVTGKTFVEREELPSADEEYSRLSTMYGVEEDTKQSLVQIVYGRGEAGVKALGKAIKGSLYGAPKKAAPKKADKPEKASEPSKESDKSDSSDAKGPSDPLN